MTVVELTILKGQRVILLPQDQTSELHYPECFALFACLSKVCSGLICIDWTVRSYIRVRSPAQQRPQGGGWKGRGEKESQLGERMQRGKEARKRHKTKWKDKNVGRETKR